MTTVLHIEVVYY